MKQEERYTSWEPQQVRKETNHLWFVSRVLPLPPVADSRSVETTSSHLRTLLMSLRQYLTNVMSLMTKTMYLDSAPMWHLISTPFPPHSLPSHTKASRRWIFMAFWCDFRILHLPHTQEQVGGGSYGISITFPYPPSPSEFYRRRVYVVSTPFPHPPPSHVTLRRT